MDQNDNRSNRSRYSLRDRLRRGPDTRTQEEKWLDEPDCCCCGCCDCCGCESLKLKSRGKLFCCCCPIQFGIWFITLTAICIAIAFSFENLFLCFNAYFDWYYPFVLTLLLIPMYVGVYFFFRYGWNSETKEDRHKLRLGSLLYCIAIFLSTLWSVIYIYCCYSYQGVYEGIGDMDEWGNYRRTSKKNFIIWQLLIGTIELGLFVYFFFVTQRWGNMADDANER